MYQTQMGDCFQDLQPATVSFNTVCDDDARGEDRYREGGREGGAMDKTGRGGRSGGDSTSRVSPQHRKQVPRSSLPLYLRNVLQLDTV